MRLLTEVLAAALLTSSRRADLAIKLGWAAVDTLHAGTVTGLLSQAVDQAAPSETRAELQFLLAFALSQAGEDVHRQRSLLAEAVAGLASRPDLLVRALLAMAIASPLDVPQAEEVKWLNRALKALNEVDDRLMQVFVLGKAAALLVVFGDPAWREVTDRVVRITGDAPQQRREANAYWSVGLAACYAGHLPTAGRLLAKGLQAEAARENRRTGTLLRSGLALLHLLEGSWEGLAEETGVLLGEADECTPARIDLELVHGSLMLARGSLDEAAERLRSVISDVREIGAYEILPLWAAAAARAAMAQDNLAEALGALSTLTYAMKGKPYWSAACWALPWAVETWVRAGQEAEAHGLVDRAKAGLSGLDAPLAPAALSLSRGILTGSVDDLITAADLYEAVPVPYEAARARERAARSLFEAGQESAAEVQLRRALSAYDRLGAAWDHARTARLARQHGMPPTRRHGGGRRGYGTELSPQERTVAELAALGHTYKEIAAKLFISHRTVDKHMGSIMRKKGARSRAELAYRLSSDETEDESKDGKVTP
jgi:DNA-binding CsgD family transcriptional regulator